MNAKEFAAALSDSRISEMLDYATAYGDFDEATPNGTPTKNGDPMSDLRRASILAFKELLHRRHVEAAAPDMFAAGKNLISFIDLNSDKMPSGYSIYLDNLRDAIAKAEG